MAWFSHFLLCPSFHPALAPSSLNLLSHIVFQSTLKPLEHQSVKTKALLPFFPFFFKTLARAAGIGSTWHALAHVSPCWQMTGADSVAAKSLRTAKETSNDRSLLLCTYFTPHSSLFTLLLPSLFYLPLCLSPSLCFFLFPLTVFISCLESGNLMKRKVKHLAGIRKHPCDNVVCVSCVCAFPQGNS